MLVLAIVSVVLITAQRPLLEFHRIAFMEQQKDVLQGDFQRFLLRRLLNPWMLNRWIWMKIVDNTDHDVKDQAFRITFYQIRNQ